MVHLLDFWWLRRAISLAKCDEHLKHLNALLNGKDFLGNIGGVSSIKYSSSSKQVSSVSSLQGGGLASLVASSMPKTSTSGECISGTSSSEQ